MVCPVYESIYCKVLITKIVCHDMHWEDDATHTLFWENLNVVMAENGVPFINFKDFMMNISQANWNVVRISMKMVTQEQRIFYSWTLDGVKPFSNPYENMWIYNKKIRTSPFKRNMSYREGDKLVTSELASRPVKTSPFYKIGKFLDFIGASLHKRLERIRKWSSGHVLTFFG